MSSIKGRFDLRLDSTGDYRVELFGEWGSVRGPADGASTIERAFAVCVPGLVRLVVGHVCAGTAERCVIPLDMARQPARDAE